MPNKLPENVRLFPSRSFSAKVMLQNIARDHGDSLKDAFIITVDDNGERFIYATSVKEAFLSVVAMEAQEMARLAVRGMIDSE